MFKAWVQGKWLGVVIDHETGSGYSKGHWLKSIYTTLLEIIFFYVRFYLLYASRTGIQNIPCNTDKCWNFNDSANTLSHTNFSSFEHVNVDTFSFKCVNLANNLLTEVFFFFFFSFLIFSTITAHTMVLRPWKKDNTVLRARPTQVFHFGRFFFFFSLIKTCKISRFGQSWRKFGWNILKMSENTFPKIF